MASSYVVLAATAAYSLASIPLALKYLGKEQFGLWALMLQISNYLQLVDLGVSSSLPRLLIDHKDQRQSLTYGSMLLTGWLTLLIPSAIILASGLVLGRWTAEIINVPEHLREVFANLLFWQCALAAFGFGTRIFGSLLVAHQRTDFYNYSQLLYFVFNFPILWVGLALGGGVFTFMWAQWIGTLASTITTILACFRLTLLPERGYWGRPSWAYFRPVFQYGRDLFLVTLGAQMIMASQTIVVARCLSLEASSVWIAGSRTFQLLCQATWRVFDVSGAAFAEMMVRGEIDRLRNRYREMLVLTASLGSYAGVGLVLCNCSFVSLWTGGRIEWSALNDLLLAIWLVLLAIGHCHNCFVLLTKKIGFMRYIYFVEGALSILLAFIFVPEGGIPAMILVSIGLMLTLDFVYGVWRVARYFRVSLFEVAMEWLTPAGRFLAFYSPMAAFCFLLTSPLPTALRFGANLAFCLTIGLMLFLRLGLTRALQEEIASRVPARFTPFLHRIFAVPVPS